MTLEKLLPQKITKTKFLSGNEEKVRKKLKMAPP